MHLPQSLDFLDERKVVAGRTCGSCSLCCRLLDVPEAGKPDHEWCPHCRPGKGVGGGCTIYQDRPATCRKYLCMWLMWPAFDARWFPKDCGIVVDFYIDKETGPLMRFHVDPRIPNRWREEPYYSTIKEFALLGLRGAAGGVRFQTLVTVRGERTRVFPHREMAYTPGVVTQLGVDRFEFLPCKSNDAAKSALASLDVLVKAGVAAAERLRGKGIQLPKDPIALMRLLAREDPEFVAAAKTIAAGESRRGEEASPGPGVNG
jgi:hypothetical protein